MSGWQEVAARYDRVAESYDRGSVHLWLADHVARFVSQVPAERILDVATGTGLAIEALIAAGSTASFTGVDISAGMLRQAGRKALAARTALLLVDANDLGFDDDAFELTICVSAMAYFRDPVRALTEWKRVTRDGRVVFTAWTEGGLTLPRLVRQAAAEVGVILPDPNSALGTEAKIRAVAAAAGLRVQRLVTVEHHEALHEIDAAAWDRVTGSEFGAPMRAAPQEISRQALARFRQLLFDAIRVGGRNVSRTFIVETVARG